MKNQNSARHLVTAALIAALYTGLTYLSSAFGLAYASLQFRLSEALNILAAFTPAAIPGLTIGCVLSNIASPFGLLDIVFGALATFCSSLLIRLIALKIKKGVTFLSILPPAILNALLVGFETVLFIEGSASFVAFVISATQVFLSEAIVCGLLGIPLYNLIKQKLNNLFN